jgi:hypothetical protein
VNEPVLFRVSVRGLLNQLSASQAETARFAEVLYGVLLEHACGCNACSDAKAALKAHRGVDIEAPPAR